jgi:hypothetical protein
MNVISTASIYVAAMSFLLCGCGTTLNPVKRKPLQITPWEITCAVENKTNLIEFENSLPDEPLDETVWDNVSGALWDKDESLQIGYTQDYSKMIVATAAGGAIGGAAIGATMGPEIIDTRIVIPFGRIFSEEFRLGLQQAFPDSSIYVSSQNLEKRTDVNERMVKIKINEFKVWERPLNHINFEADIQMRISPTNKEPEFICDVHDQMTNQLIGTAMSTSSGFIAKINKLSNQFAINLSTKLLEKMQQTSR